MIVYLKLIRIQNLFIASLAVLVATYSIRTYDVVLLFHCVLSVILAMSFGNVLNDIIDLKPDKTSHPNRPLPMKQINISSAKKLLFILCMLIIILSFFLNIIACASLLLLVLPLLISYNFYFKSTPFLGNIIISFLLSFVFIFTELVFLNELKIMIVPSLLVFGLSLIREFLKDIHDYQGDKKHAIKTLPVSIGQNKSVTLAILMILTFCILSLIPYFTNLYQKNYLISLIILVEIPLIILVSLLLRNPNKLMFRKISSITKIISLSGLLVILISNS